MAGTKTQSLEYLVIVDVRGGALEAFGCVTREVAHSTRRIPHATTLIVPVFVESKDIMIHRKPRKKIGGGKWDFAGGHVTFEPDVLSGPAALLACIEKTAVREAREEVLVACGGIPHLILERDVVRCTAPGELPADEPENVEFSTGYIVRIPEDASVLMVDEGRDGTVEQLVTQRLTLTELYGMFRGNRDQFADGAARILDRECLASWLDRVR